MVREVCDGAWEDRSNLPRIGYQTHDRKNTECFLREHRSLPCPWIRKVIVSGVSSTRFSSNGSRFQDISPKEATGFRVLRYKACSRLHVRSSVSSSFPPPVPPKCLLHLLPLRPSKWGHSLCPEFGMVSGNSRVTHGELRPVRRSVKPWKDTPNLDISHLVSIVDGLKLNIFLIILFSDMVRHTPIPVDFRSLISISIL